MIIENRTVEMTIIALLVLLLIPLLVMLGIPFDQTPLAEQLGSALLRLGSWSWSEEEFVDHILARIPPTPPNYSRIVELNESGAALPADLTELEAGANRCAIG